MQVAARTHCFAASHGASLVSGRPSGRRCVAPHADKGKTGEQALTGVVFNAFEEASSHARGRSEA